MGNCLACLRSPDAGESGTGQGPNTSGSSANRSGKSQRAQKHDGLLPRVPHVPQNFTVLVADGAIRKAEAQAAAEAAARNAPPPAYKLQSSPLAGDPGASAHCTNAAATATANQQQQPPSQQQPAAQQVSDNTLNTLFEEYKDDQEDAILAEGIERLCADLGYKPDDFAILVLAWRLNASQMCRFTQSEFIAGLQAMPADTIAAIRQRLEATVAQLRASPSTGSDQFKQLYRFTFAFGLEPGNRLLSLDMALGLWRLVFSAHPPAILERWLDFLEQQHSQIRGVPKDTWNMFLNFAETVDIEQYDDTEAWPSLFDDFVEYETDRRNQNEVRKAAKPGDEGEEAGNGAEMEAQKARL